jgi:CheY-like chemotaxis protein
MLKFDTQLLMNQESSQIVFNWHGKKILIVEEDYVNYLFFHEILASSYACLIRAVSLQECFDMLGSGKQFDLILINSGISGNENCRSVKRIKLLWPHVRVIAISEKDCKDLRKCHNTCCDTIISQHNDSHDIRLVVNEMFYPVN